MTKLQAGAEFPKQEVAKLGGGTMVLGQPGNGKDWQLVVVYRGKHCPLCKKYLAKLEELLPEFHDNGVDVVAVSGDPLEKAEADIAEMGVTMPVGYDLSVAQMQALGLYVTTPRGPQETDRPFPEPGVFVINEHGTTQVIDISNSPFVRPDLENIAGGLKYIRANDYPIRGTHTG